MDLDVLPPELTWNILENLTDLKDRKNASLVCKAWNRMLFNSSKSLRNVRVRFCLRPTALDGLEPNEILDRMFEVMFRSKRNYVTVEFFHINFERLLARDFLFFVVQLCCDTIECVRFTNCYGLKRSELWQLLSLLGNLRELVVSGGIKYDELDQEVVKLPLLEKLTLDIGDDCRLYRDFPSQAPNLKCFSVRTIYGCADLRDVTITRSFSHQLNSLSFSTNRSYNYSEFSEMNFTNLTKLDLKVSGSLWPQLFKQTKLIQSLKLEANINDDIIATICTTCTKIKTLTLFCSNLIESIKFNMLTRLENLEQLSVRGIHKFSWRHISFPKLKSLHLDNVGNDFTNFLKDLKALESLEIHDTKLRNEQLIKITLNAPTVRRLELAFCTKISDKGFKHLSDMVGLEELRLWAIQVSKTIDERLLCPRLRKIILYFNDNIEDCTLEGLAKRIPQLQQLVLYDCYRMSPQGVVKLRQVLPNCHVLELYRGDELPPVLSGETQIYYRNAEYPNGVLKQELPFQWF
ncbi:uncharacterized protein LOC129744486 [Uranotaenia lowii]|uniref:uncharacterized protein LOC129744486 n=1 Tax=Uranotaenia lowii TaxID=190385 RepID=UPI002479BC02|nr:uncharacterized protein LOC129744486 [Uranotaenia lowii]